MLHGRGELRAGAIVGAAAQHALLAGLLGGRQGAQGWGLSSARGGQPGLLLHVLLLGRVAIAWRRQLPGLGAATTTSAASQAASTPATHKAATTLRGRGQALHATRIGATGCSQRAARRGRAGCIPCSAALLRHRVA